MTILVVDDDPICLRLITRSLEKWGHEALAAQSVKEAVQQLQSRSQVDLLITDLRMPEMDGFDLVEYLRQVPRLADLPVLICTSMATRDAIIRARELNIAGYVIKPLDMRIIHQKIDEASTQAGGPLADVEATLQRLQVSAFAYADFLGDLSQQLGPMLVKMKKLAVEQDFAALSTCIETVSVRAQNIGAEALFDTLVQLTQAVERQETGRVQALLEDVGEQRLRLQRAIKRLESQVNAPSPSSK